jgi:hypothetical protein
MIEREIKMKTSQLEYAPAVAKTDAIITDLYDLIERINEENPLLDERLVVAAVMDLIESHKIKLIN